VKCSSTCPLRIAKEKETSLKNGSKAITVAKSKITLMKKYGVTNAWNIEDVEKRGYPFFKELKNGSTKENKQISRDLGMYLMPVLKIIMIILIKL